MASCDSEDADVVSRGEPSSHSQRGHGRPTWDAVPALLERHGDARSVHDLVELELEVMRADAHPALQVEAVCIEAVDARVQVELPAALPSGLLDEPLHQGAGASALAGRLPGHEVVDVHEMAPGQVVSYTEACGARRLLLAIEEAADQAIAVGLLRPHARDEFVPLHVRSELGHRLEGEPDLVGVQLPYIHEADTTPDYDVAMAFWDGRKVLVTGGTGFLGRAVCRRIAERGSVELITPRARDFNLREPDDVQRLFADARPDLVLHLAASVGGIGANMRRPAELYLDNLLMGTYVIEAARRHEVSKTVIVGTICSYPKVVPTPFDEDSLWDGYPEETNAPYGIAKKALLVHAQANRKQYGQRSIYLLPTNLYGPGDKFHPDVSHVIPALIKKFVDATERGDDAVQVWGTGSVTREFLFVEDAAEGIVNASERYDAEEPLNLGSGEEITIKDLADLIARLTGFAGRLEWDTSKPDGQPRRFVDASRARRAFGFEASTPLEVGLKTTIDWYLGHREEAERDPRA